MSFPAAFAGRGLRLVRDEGALIDDLHAGTPVFSAPLAAAGGQIRNKDISAPQLQRFNAMFITDQCGETTCTSSRRLDFTTTV